MLTPVQPDAAYCVYCHAEASGPCATCQALVCADCSELTGGSVKRVAVCTRCHAQGAGAVTWRAWWPVVRLALWVVVSIAGGALLLALLVEAAQ